LRFVTWCTPEKIDHDESEWNSDEFIMECAVVKERHCCSKEVESPRFVTRVSKNRLLRD